MIWRQIGSVREAVRVLHEDGVLWVPPLSVSQQAVAQRVLLARPLADLEGNNLSSPITVILNWTALLTGTK